jgi:hypothetical protein
MIDPLEHLSNQFLSAIHLKTFSLYAYGSCLYPGAEARDVDLVLISAQLSAPSLSIVSTNIARGTVPANLYLVPESCFRADVEGLAYGGFYAHKFAFAFRLLAKDGDAPDAGRAFWSYQLQRYRMGLTDPVEPEALMRSVHREIYAFNPFIARSMTKFLSSPEAYEGLRAFLADRVIAEPLDVSAPSGSSTWQDECERVLYRFWAEYRRHKQKTNTWGEAVREKMVRSLREADYALLERYMAAGNHNAETQQW